MNEFSLKLEAMGGEFIYKCYPQNFLNKEEVEALFIKAHKEVLRIENKFTDFKDSEFNEINELAGIRPCHVDQEILDLILKSIEYSNLSNGSFDISFATIGHKWREAKREGIILCDKKRKKLAKLVNYKDIEIDEKAQTVYLPHPDMRIGLGGIGKGYAVDQAYEVLKDGGLYNFYINGSGDIRTHSHSNAPRKWRVGIRNPLSEDPSKSVGLIQIANGSVCTSGNYKNFNNSKTDHHIIDSKTGQSKNDVISATVLSGDTVTSDVYGTILMNLNVREGIDLLNKNQLTGLLISSEGKSYLSQKAIQVFGI